MKIVINAIGILSVVFGIAASAYSIGVSHGRIALLSEQEQQDAHINAIAREVRAMSNQDLLRWEISR